MKLLGARAPPERLPTAHFLAIPLWMLVAAWLFASRGEQLIAARWAPATLALVHVWVLGVLGNGMLGSLQQFLPVAAGVDTRWLQRLGLGLCGLFNLGLGLLLAGFLAWPAGRAWGGVVLALALLPFAALALRALCGVGWAQTPRWQLSTALVCLGTAGALGLYLSIGRGALPGLTRAQTVDLHAMLGLAAGVIGLLAAVGSVVLPMFQGLARWSERSQRRLWLAAAGVLVLALSLRINRAVDSLGFALLAALPALWLGGSVLLGQWQRRSRRRPGLVRAWCIGWLQLIGAVLLAALGALSGRDAAIGAAAWLLLAGALPLLLQGMLLEILPFLHWNRLVLSRPLGSHAHLPGVDALLPERDKRAMLPISVAFSLALLAAACGAGSPSWLLAGALLATQAAALAAVMLACLKRAAQVAVRYGLTGDAPPDAAS